MAFEIPGWAYPLFEAYNLPWPDIDEDDFETMRQPLRNFGTDLRSVGDAIGEALDDLLAGNPSETLRAVQEYFGDVKSGFLDPIDRLCQDLAAVDGPCVIAYQAVQGVKEGLVVILGGEIGNSIADFLATVATVGLDSALTAAEQLGVYEAISRAVSYGITEVSNKLSFAASGMIDNFVSSIVQPFINRAEGEVAHDIDSYIPQLVFKEISSTTDGLAGRLHLSPEQLDTCLAAITSSTDHLAEAVSKLDPILENLFNAPAPGSPSGSSSAMRVVVKGIVATIESELVAAISHLVQQVESHFVDILQDYARALEDLDQQARSIASNVKAARGADVLALSVIGVGTVAAAPRVSATSGGVNAEEANFVQIETVSMLDATADLAVAVDATSVGASPAEAVTAVEDLQTPAAASNVTTGSVTSNAGSVADLTTAKATDVTLGPVTSNTGSVADLTAAKPAGTPHVATVPSTSNTGSVADLTTAKPADTPHLAPVSGAAHTASTLETARSQRPQRVDAAGGSDSGAANVARLAVTKEGEGPRGPERAEGSANNVHEIERPATDAKRPVIDASPVEVDEEA